MDYLIFVIGMFLLAGGLAGVFLQRELRATRGWFSLAGAAGVMALACFTQIIAFPLATEGALWALSAVEGGVALGLLARFLMISSGQANARAWATAVAFGLAGGILGWLDRGGWIFAGVASVAGGWAGWRAARLSDPEGESGPVPAGLGAMLLAWISPVSLHPGMVEIAYDIAGMAMAPVRVFHLAALALAGLAAILWSGFLWSRVGRASLSEGSSQLQRRGKLGSMGIAAAFVALVAYGGWIARWLGEQARAEQSTILLSAVKIGAASLHGGDLAKMRGDASDLDDTDYPVIQQKLADVRAALPQARFIYTVGWRPHQTAEGNPGEAFVYLVDSEPVDSEDFSPPGQKVEEDPAKWLDVLQGRTYFGGPEKDDWGVWFTALVPVMDDAHRAVAILGVDFAAREWVRPLAFRRLAAMGATLSAGCLLLGLFAFHRVSLENTLRVARLSERLSDAMDAADFDAWEWHPSRGEILLGQRVAKRLGIADGSALVSVRRFWRHIHPEDRAGLARLLRSVSQQGGNSAEIEVRLLEENGQSIWMLLRGRVVTVTADRRPLRVVGTMLNVQDTRRSRVEIEGQRRFAQHVMESVPSGLAVVGADGRLTYVNRAFVHMAMREEGFLIGHSLDSLLAVPSAVVGSDGFEARLHRPDGSELPVQAFRAPLAESGSEGGSILAVIDLSSTKDAEQALLRSRAEARRLALVAQRTDNAVVITDAAGRIEWVNEGFTRISGYDRTEVLGRRPGAFLQRGQDDPEAREFMRRRILAGEGFETELRNFRKDGTQYLVRIECQPLKDKNDILTGFMAIERDVTREREMEHALAEQRGRIDEINRCLLGLGGSYGENVRQLTSLVARLFDAPTCLYTRMEGDQPVPVSEFGRANLLPRLVGQGPVHDVITGRDRFLLVEDMFASSYAFRCPEMVEAGYRSIAAQAIEIEGERLGALLLCFESPRKMPDDFQSCLALVARAIGREEVIAKGRRELDASLRGLTVEKTRLDVLLSSIEGGVLVEDGDGRTILASEGMRGIFEVDPTALVGRPGRELAGDLAGSFRNRVQFQEGFSHLLGQSEAVTGEELEMNNGTILYRDFVPIREGETRYGVLWHYRDVTRMRRSARLLEAVASVSSTLLSPKMRDTHWGEVLESLGRAAGVDRAYIFRHHPHLETGLPAMSQLAEWNSGSAAPQIHNEDLQDLAFGASGFQRWYDELSAGREIAGFVATFPDAERPLLEEQNILSLAVVPIFSGEEFWGFVGFDVCRESRRWEKWELALLRSAAANIGLRMVVQKESDALLRARDDARQAALSAEEANRAKSTFLATMSHEIRTPLNAVIGMASLLETTPLNNQQQDYAETVLRSSHFLLELINDVLDYSRIESGRIDLDSSVFSVGDLCREVFDVVRGAALGKDLEMVCRVAPHLPMRHLGDPGRLRQILVNLLGNAVKFTHHGLVSLDVDGSPCSDGRWHLVFEVRDTGIGISPESIGLLFQPFIQGDSSTTRRFGGSGLGLAISRRLAQLMDGDIMVESTVGKGSVFTATVCLTPAARAGATRAGSSMVLPAEAASLRLLVVDDTAMNRKVLEELLAETGLAARSAASAAEAIALWKSDGPFDVVLTDYHMPEMDGADLARQLRKQSNATGTRFVLISSDTELAPQDRGLFDAVISKPVWPRAFQTMLAGLLPGAVSLPADEPRLAEESSGVELSRLRVLVAEDNPNNQKVIRLLLRRLGIQPEIVANGLEAVQAVMTKPWDVVFLDVQMPVMDGLEASRRIHSLGLTKQPSVVALTANAFKEDREAVMDAGMDHYMTKPVTLGKLRELLTQIVRTNAPDGTPLPGPANSSESLQSK